MVSLASQSAGRTTSLYLYEFLSTVGPHISLVSASNSPDYWEVISTKFGSGRLQNLEIRFKPLGIGVLFFLNLAAYLCLQEISSQQMYTYAQCPRNFCKRPARTVRFGGSLHKRHSTFLLNKVNSRQSFLLFEKIVHSSDNLI